MNSLSKHCQANAIAVEEKKRGGRERRGKTLPHDFNVLPIDFIDSFKKKQKITTDGDK